MASTDLVPSPRNQRFLARILRQERPGPRRTLMAAATPIDLRNKTEARRLRTLRQGWQEDAGNYVDAIPELSFAYRFMAHCSGRMQYFPAFVNPEDPSGPPVPVKDVSGLPQSFVDACNESMNSIGVGRIAMSPLQKDLSYNFGVTGEAFIVGMQAKPEDPQDWKIRSIDEFVVWEDQYRLREAPLDPQGVLGWIDIDPATTYAARIWTPHWRFKKVATSPMRSLLDVAEELMLLSRDVRAVARSRLAGAGILKVPEGMRMVSFEGGQNNGEVEEWFGQFAELMMAPIAEEGVASSVVPIAISGPADALAQLEHLVIDRPYSALAMDLRAEAIGRLATGLDVPREVLEGMSDPNHWGAWLVSDDTFRHHIEPQQIDQVDALTQGFHRPWLTTAGMPPELVSRACIWYDPVELISKPDPMANAIQLHDRFVISNLALLEAGGFDEKDQPDSLEVEFRMLQKTRTFPPNMVEAIFHAYDPHLTFPPITTSGTIPGISPTGEEIEALPPAPVPGETPTGGTPAVTGPPPVPASTPSALPPGPSIATEPVPFAAGPTPPRVTLTHRRLSAKLGAIDTVLRTRIQQAANDAMLRLLDRAGARLIGKVADKRFATRIPDVDATREAVAGVPKPMVASILGPTVVSKLGYANSQALLDADWSDLRTHFGQWVRASQRQALRTACQLAQIDPDDARARRAARALDLGVDAAWTALEAELAARAEHLLYRPGPGNNEPTVDPNTVVPAGIIRRALTIAGGGQPKRTIVAAAGDDEDDEEGSQPTIDVSSPTDVGTDPAAARASVDIDGQIGTGDAISGMLTDSDMQVASYEWVHGPTMNPFEPHEDLDGETFSSFTDDILANPSDWPDNDFLFPGDHDGCSCDFNTTWGPADDATASDNGGGDASTSDGIVQSTLEQAVVSMAQGPSDVQAGATDLTAVRSDVLQDITAQKAEAQRNIEQLGVHTIARPAALTRTAEGTRSAEGGEWDWYYQLDSAERDRLRNNGWVEDKGPTSVDRKGLAPDQVVAPFEAATGTQDASTEGAMRYWLDQTRTIDAANVIASRGNLPANLARFGDFNFETLSPNTPYSVTQLFAPKAEAITYLQQAQADQAADLVTRELTGNYGAPMYQMSYEEYAGEIETLSAMEVTPISSDDEWGEVYDADTQKAISRLNELLPETLAPGDMAPDLHAVWAQGVAIAKIAGLPTVG